MQCPFTLEEKQALLEAPGLADRAELIASLLAMALTADLSVSATRH
jgi:Lon protease-like protein